METDKLFNYFRGNASESEKEAIGQWLATDSKAPAEYKKAQFLFEGTILNETALDGSTRRTLRSRIPGYAAAAAVAAVFFIAGLRLGNRMLASDAPEPMMSVETHPGERSSVTLSDGTVVHLNSCTRLQYPARFGKNRREVRIDGEALFEVARDEARPFIAGTFASEIKVLGTRFNVRADEAKGIFSTTLTNGKVEVTGKADGASVTLSPGETVTLSNGTLQKGQDADPALLCWLEGNVDLRAESFASLMNRLEDAFGMKIIVDMEKEPSVEGLSGQIRISEGIEHALKTLQHAMQFSYRIDDSTRTITIREH